MKATAESMTDNSPVYEDGNIPLPTGSPKKTAYSQSLSHYVDIVSEATGGETHYIPTAADFGNDGSFGNKIPTSISQAAPQKVSEPQKADSKNTLKEVSREDPKASPSQ